MTGSSARIAIIGAGFCGATVAVNLLLKARRPVEIHLINRGELMARGTAYGTRSPHHLLNVPAARMGMLASDEGGFLRFLQRHVSPEIRGNAFVGRQLYGQYLEETLNAAAFTAAAGVELVRRQDEALSLIPEESGYRIAFASGVQEHFARVVLALGNQAPSSPGRLEELRTDARYIADPWSHDLAARVPRDRPVAFVGTGLSMVDALLQLHRWGHPGPYWAISPRGLLPLSHRELAGPPPGVDLSPMLAQHSARSLLRCVREAASTQAAAGGDWRDVLAALRPVTSSLWGNLPHAERRRFLRHARRYWEIHRHRLAPATAREIQLLRDEGRLRIIRGRVHRASARRDSLFVEVVSGASPEGFRLPVGALVNCTGPNTSLEASTNPLLRDMAARGLLCSDPLGIGLHVNNRYQPLNRRGQESPNLHYVGPMLQARYWEATAVPELREHAARVVEAILVETSVECSDAEGRI